MFGAALYDETQAEGATATAVAASLGCGVPTAVADLHEGETVLDLGSGAGADVLISARRVGASGKAIGLDMTDEMLELARANAADAGLRNVEFVKGYIEDIPLPNGSVDVIVSNCVLNLSGDKPKVLAEAARVLKPGGRFAVSDVIASPDMDEATRADMAAFTGCIAGALTEEEFRAGLSAAGFTDIEIRETHRVHEQATSAIIRARKPGTAAVNRRLELYEPAMCCQTGVCGPSVDQALIDVREDLRWAESQGAQVARHNLSSDPDAFVANPKVTGLMQAFGEAALPVLVVDGNIAIHGRYPSRGELADVLATKRAVAVELPQSSAVAAVAVPVAAEISLPDPTSLSELDWTGWGTRYLFFTGKGGVGKTTTASAAAVALADAGKRTLIISTDPASNLDDVFGVTTEPQPTAVPGVQRLFVSNLDPQAAATAFKERAIGRYRGVLPDAAIASMEEQLSGACTVEIAAFNEFTAVLAAPEQTSAFDHVIFDTAPTGHTLRLLTLPSAWSGYVDEHPAGASCLGPLAGLDQRREQYAAAVKTLSDPELTTLVLVARAEESALREAAHSRDSPPSACATSDSWSTACSLTTGMTPPRSRSPTVRPQPSPARPRSWQASPAPASASSPATSLDWRRCGRSPTLTPTRRASPRAAPCSTSLDSMNSSMTSTRPATAW